MGGDHSNTRNGQGIVVRHCQVLKNVVGQGLHCWNLGITFNNGASNKIV